MSSCHRSNDSSSGSEVYSDDPCENIDAIKEELDCYSKESTQWKHKCDIHGDIMGHANNKLNKAYYKEMKQRLKAESRIAKL